MHLDYTLYVAIYSDWPIHCRGRRSTARSLGGTHFRSLQNTLLQKRRSLQTGGTSGTMQCTPRPQPFCAHCNATKCTRIIYVRLSAWIDLGSPNGGSIEARHFGNPKCGPDIYMAMGTPLPHTIHSYPVSCKLGPAITYKAQSLFL